MLPRNGYDNHVQCDKEGLGIEERRLDRTYPGVINTVVHQNVLRVVSQKEQEARRRL